MSLNWYSKSGHLIPRPVSKRVFESRASVSTNRCIRAHDTRYVGFALLTVRHVTGQYHHTPPCCQQLRLRRFRPSHFFDGENVIPRSVALQVSPLVGDSFGCGGYKLRCIRFVWRTAIDSL